MAGYGDPIEGFRRVTAEVAAGRMSMKLEAAAAAANRCDQYIHELQKMKESGKFLVKVEAFGTLGSAQALGQKFQALAMGGPGITGFTQACEQRIDLIKDMKDFFLRAGAAVEAQEHENARVLSTTFDGK